MKKFSAALAVLFLAGGLAGLAAQTPDWNRVLTRIDEMGDFENNDFSAEITIVSQKPGEEDSTIVAKYYRRDREKMFTIEILKPDIQNGQGYFSAGDDMWFYDPKSGKFAYFTLKDTFQDSDAQNSDFASSTLAVDYDVAEYLDTQLGSTPVWEVTLVAKNRTVAVAKRKLWIRKDNYLVLKEEHYSASDRKMRVIAYPRYQTVNGKFVPVSMLIVDSIKVGERTQITFANPVVDRLSDAIFNKEYLKN